MYIYKGEKFKDIYSISAMIYKETKKEWDGKNISEKIGLLEDKMEMVEFVGDNE